MKRYISMLLVLCFVFVSSAQTNHELLEDLNKAQREFQAIKFCAISAGITCVILVVLHNMKGNELRELKSRTERKTKKIEAAMEAFSLRVLELENKEKENN